MTMTVNDWINHAEWVIVAIWFASTALVALLFRFGWWIHKSSVIRDEAIERRFGDQLTELKANFQRSFSDMKVDISGRLDTLDRRQDDRETAVKQFMLALLTQPPKP